MSSHRHLPKKRFGQNFLSDDAIINEIVNVIHPQPGDRLVEIGPGLGAITLPLLSQVARMDAIELDRDIIPLLREKTKTLGTLEIHQQDALAFNLSDISTDKASLRVVGNLPYNISTPLLFHLFEQKDLIIDMHFMLQKEVAERLTANPGSKQYGRLSVMAQYHCQIEALIDVPAQSFTPPPKVESMFIRLVPIQPVCLAQDIHRLNEVVKAAFSQRRKTLHNALKKLISKDQLLSIDIDPNKRAEELSVVNFVKISNIIKY